MNTERKALISQVEWNSGGYGFGVCSMANSMMWAMDTPDPENGKPDLKSTVAVLRSTQPKSFKLWVYGPMYSKTLPEAIAVFTKELN